MAYTDSITQVIVIISEQVFSNIFYLLIKKELCIQCKRVGKIQVLRLPGKRTGGTEVLGIKNRDKQKEDIPCPPPSNIG